MFLMNSSQREDKAGKEYTNKIIKDVLKISLFVIGLKLAAAVINKNWLHEHMEYKYHKVEYDFVCFLYIEICEYIFLLI